MKARAKWWGQGWGEDSFLQLCNSVTGVNSELSECSEPSACWNVDCKSLIVLFTNPQTTPAPPICFPTTCLSVFLYTQNVFHSPTFLSVYLCMVHLILLLNISIWPHFSLMRQTHNGIEYNIYSFICSVNIIEHILCPRQRFSSSVFSSKENRQKKLPWWSLHSSGDTINKIIGKLYRILEGSMCWERNKLGGKRECWRRRS